MGSNIICCAGYSHEESAKKLAQGLEERWKRFFVPNLMILALVLDSFQKLRHFRPDALTWLDINSWVTHYYRNWFKKEPQQLHLAIVKYKEEKFPFNVAAYSSFQRNPLSFWRLLVDQNAGIGELARLAAVLFEVCPHAAGIERVWSVMDGIHTKSRNRLTLPKVIGAASIKLEIQRNRMLSKGTGAVALSGDSIEASNGGLADAKSDTSDQPYESEHEDNDEISDVVLKFGALEDGSLDVLAWLDNDAPPAHFDRFLTLEELFSLE